MANGIIQPHSAMDFITMPRRRLSKSNNMNNIEPGIYYQSGGEEYYPSNAPEGAYNAYVVVTCARPGDRVQFWYSVNLAHLYFRSYNGGTWTTWRTVA